MLAQLRLRHRRVDHPEGPRDDRRLGHEPVTVGAYAGEKIDRGEFQAMLSRFYEVSSLTPEGAPSDDFRDALLEVSLELSGARAPLAETG